MTASCLCLRSGKKLGKLQPTVLLWNVIFVKCKTIARLNIYLTCQENGFFNFQNYLLIASMKTCSHSKRQAESLGICHSFCGMNIGIFLLQEKKKILIMEAEHLGDVDGREYDSTVILLCAKQWFSSPHQLKNRPHSRPMTSESFGSRVWAIITIKSSPISSEAQLRLRTFKVFDQMCCPTTNKLVQ